MSASGSAGPGFDVVYPSGAWIENRPHSTPSIRLARDPKHVIVQWVGIGTHNFSLRLFFLAHTKYPWHYSSEEPRLTDKRLLPDGSIGALWLATRYLSALISVFLTGFRYFSYQVATQLSSRDWVDPVPDPILPEKFPGYSRKSNPGPLKWQSGMLTTLPNRRSNKSVALQPRRAKIDWSGCCQRAV